MLGKQAIETDPKSISQFFVNMPEDQVAAFLVVEEIAASRHYQGVIDVSRLIAKDLDKEGKTHTGRNALTYKIRNSLGLSGNAQMSVTQCTDYERWLQYLAKGPDADAKKGDKRGRKPIIVASRGHSDELVRCKHEAYWQEAEKKAAKKGYKERKQADRPVMAIEDAMKRKGDAFTPLNCLYAAEGYAMKRAGQYNERLIEGYAKMVLCRNSWAHRNIMLTQMIERMPHTKEELDLLGYNGKNSRVNAEQLIQRDNLYTSDDFGNAPEGVEQDKASREGASSDRDCGASSRQCPQQESYRQPVDNDHWAQDQVSDTETRWSDDQCVQSQEPVSEVHEAGLQATRGPVLHHEYVSESDSDDGQAGTVGLDQSRHGRVRRRRHRQDDGARQRRRPQRQCQNSEDLPRKVEDQLPDDQQSNQQHLRGHVRRSGQEGSITDDPGLAANGPGRPGDNWW